MTASEREVLADTLKDYKATLKGVNKESDFTTHADLTAKIERIEKVLDESKETKKAPVAEVPSASDAMSCGDFQPSPDGGLTINLENLMRPGHEVANPELYNEFGAASETTTSLFPSREYRVRGIDWFDDQPFVADAMTARSAPAQTVTVEKEDTSNKNFGGAGIAEGAAAALSSYTAETETLTMYKFGTRMTFTDEARYDFNHNWPLSYTRARLRFDMRNLRDQYLAVGTGTSNTPLGILQKDATNLLDPTGSRPALVSGAVDYQALLERAWDVAAEMAQGSGTNGVGVMPSVLLMNYKTYQAIAKLKVSNTDSRYLFNDAGMRLPVAGTVGRTLAGMRVILSQRVPDITISSTAHPGNIFVCAPQFLENWSSTTMPKMKQGYNSDDLIKGKETLVVWDMVGVHKRRANAIKRVATATS